MPVSTGASGLGLGLARASGLTLGERRREHAPHDGPSAILVGSCSARSLEQVAAAERDDAGAAPRRRPAGGERRRRGGGARLGGVAARAGAGPRRGERRSGGGARGAGPPRPRGGECRDRGRARARSPRGWWRRGCAGWSWPAARPRARWSTGSASRASGSGPEIAPGVPVLATLGRDEPLTMALKSGNFGGPDFFERALTRL